MLRERVKALRIYVAGRVQGVGFRPFIHRIALEARVSGRVRNLGGGEVEIWVEGRGESVERFLKLLRERMPPPAEVEELKVEEVEPNGFEGFKILESSGRRVLASSLPPDLGICESCLAEVLNPESRWYRYPFNSCAWCGPRYSMMYRPPYDRENTAMKAFPLCRECSGEYRDLHNERRYHAQGISCSKCGPRLMLLDGELRLIECGDPLREAAKLIEEGHIVAVKGVGGFHIACLASDDEVVLELRGRKRRRRKPFALMALDLETAGRLVELTPEAEKLLKSPARPILLLPRAEGSPASEWVAPGLRTLGVMLPYTPLHHLLLAETRDRFLIMTSGNLGGDPMVRDEAGLQALRGVADAFLVHNREIVNRVDDPVVRPTRGGWTTLRCGRGLAPLTLRSPTALPDNYAALGAELQTAPAVGFDETLILAPYSGDTSNPKVLKEHMGSLDFLLRSYGLSEADEGVVVADPHPLYSTRRAAERLAERLGWRLRLVQHHFAHTASAMAEHAHPLEEPAVGVAIDGVGYGLDGAIWGGEVVAWDGETFRRVGRLEYHVMPGGDLAVLRPPRMLASILSKLMEPREIMELFKGLGLLEKLPHGVKELEACLRLVEGGRPLTSSAGRFLDSVSSLLGVCFERTYEGEPAIALEDAAKGGSTIIERVDDLIDGDGKVGVVLTSRLMELLLQNLSCTPKRDLAYTAQYLLGKSLGELAREAMESVGARRLYASGGAAVNEIILRGLAEGAGVEPLLNRRVPANDGGIAVGQIYAAAMLEPSR